MWKYDRSGRFVLGLPARDISEEEWRGYSTELREEARKLKLYDHEPDANPRRNRTEPTPESKVETPLMPSGLAGLPVEKGE